MTEQKNKNGDGRLMSIREVSLLTGVPPHTLRFWEKEMPDILQPERTQGGQRRYDTDMAERVRMIKELSQEGKCSLGRIRQTLGNSRPRESEMGIRLDTQSQQLIEHLVDEIAELLKSRLLHVLQSKHGASSGHDQ